MTNTPGTPSVSIVGGGNVGVELGKAHEGSMHVRLIERADAFTHAPAMIRALVGPSLLDQALIPYDRLLSKGQFIRGEATSIDGKGVTLSDGTKVAADKRLIVDQWMRPSSLPNVFATGDATDNGDLMTIVAISRQAPWLAKLLKAAASGKPVESQGPYKPWGKAPILVPLGPKRGSSFLMIATLGDWVTSKMKGRDLFIAKYRKLLGQN